MERYWDVGVYVGIVIAGALAFIVLLWISTFIVGYFRDMAGYREEVKAYPERKAASDKERFFGRHGAFWVAPLEPRLPVRPKVIDTLLPVGAGLLAMAVLAGVVYAAGYPWEAQFHSRSLVTGEVIEKVERTPYTAEGTPTQIMFRLAGDGEERFVYDSLRAVDAEIGQEIRLMCRQVWVYSGQSWSSCLWADERVNH